MDVEQIAAIAGAVGAGLITALGTSMALLIKVRQWLTANEGKIRRMLVGDLVAPSCDGVPGHVDNEGTGVIKLAMRGELEPVRRELSSQSRELASQARRARRHGELLELLIEEGRVAAQHRAELSARLGVVEQKETRETRH